jgi:hypothetical protein
MSASDATEIEPVPDEIVDWFVAFLRGIEPERD